MSNYFYFITVYECSADFCECLRFTSKDPWYISIYGNKSTDTTLSKKWDYIESSLSEASTRYLVYDYTEPGNSRDVNDCLSSQWTLKMTGNKANMTTYYIQSRLVDSLNKEIEPFNYTYYTMSNGTFTKNHDADITIGRISSYDSNDITQEDIGLLQNFLLGEESLSSLQYKLADYDNNGEVNGFDLAAMRQHIASLNGTSMSLEECICEIGAEISEEINDYGFSFDEFMNGEMVNSANLLF